jgi:hypothetical protein
MALPALNTETARAAPDLGPSGRLRPQVKAAGLRPRAGLPAWPGERPATAKRPSGRGAVLVAPIPTSRQFRLITVACDVW